MKQKTMFMAAAAGLLFAFVGAAVFYTSQQDQAAAQRAQSNTEALIRPHSPTIGPADAPVVIVEFLDPACETCRDFYPFVKEIMAEHPGKIRLVVRYAPFHPGSDKVVAVLEAARRQDKLWPTLEALFASQQDWAPHHTPQIDLVWKHLEGLGLNLEQMAYDITAPEIERLIAQDLTDAKTLNVTMTPEFFVNGRPLPSFGAEQLKNLVDEEIAAVKS